jgi:arabinose-5-phosphate isomerase
MTDKKPYTQASEGEKLRALGRSVIETEKQAVASLIDRIDDQFVDACVHILNCEGRTIVLGMGKSGHIGGKIAATLASTGSPAFYVHPGEASHGDMGMITDKDVVLALSNSGTTEEIIALLPMIKRLGVPLIALTGNSDSELASKADIHIDVSVEKEACPLDLAPTSSTTAALAMGDAIAIALLEARGFGPEDYARSHPGGALGRRLLLLVKDIMHKGQEVPVVSVRHILSDALIEMTEKKLGTTAVVDENKKLVGIYTDGDLRRSLDANIDIHETTVGEVMISDCKTIGPEQLAVEALNIMEQYKISALLVTDDNGTLVGALNMQDLLRARVF